MISRRASSVDASGIRKVFDLAAKLKSPVNLSIGQPDFDAFDVVKEEAKRAIDAGKNSYTVTQGIEELRERLRAQYGVVGSLKEEYDLFLTAGVSAGLFLSFMALLDPGDEILIPDPYFCIYRDLALMVNAVPSYYDTYPDFSLSAERIEAGITPRTKAIVVNSPSNPTGYAVTEEELDAVIEVAARHGLYLIYDEIYSNFVYEHQHVGCFTKYDKSIILNGFSKSAGVCGWRAGYVLAPKDVAAAMLKLQQYSFVCMNSVAQWALLAALDVDFEPIRLAYKAKRDFVVSALSEKFSFVVPGGAFYLFPKAPLSDASQFVERCIANNLLVIPGNVFSRRNTHFRLSFAAPQGTLERGVEILNRLCE